MRAWINDRKNEYRRLRCVHWSWRRGVAAIRAREDQRYLNHFLRTLRQKSFDSGHGSTFPSISQEQLSDLIVPLPSLSEQKRIAGILDQAEGLRRKRQQALALTDQFLPPPSSTSSATPSPTPNAGRQVTCRVWRKSPEDSHSRANGLSRPGERSFASVTSKMGTWIRLARSASTEFKTRSGDLLMALSGATTGKQVVTDADDGAFVNRRVAIIRAMNPESRAYLRWTLKDSRVINDLLKTAGGSAQANLSPNDLRSCPIPLPLEPVMKKFSAIESSMSQKLRRLGQDSSQKTEALFNFLVQRAFRGEL